MILECISDDIPPQNANFEYGYPHSNALLQFPLKLERCKLHKAACHPTKCDIINDDKLFLTVYRRIYCHKFLMLSNQKLRYKSNCIRIRYIQQAVRNLCTFLRSQDSSFQQLADFFLTLILYRPLKNRHNKDLKNNW